MRCIENDLPHHIADLGKLVHEVNPVMKTTCRVDYHHICILGHSRLDRIKCNRSRIRTHGLLHDVDTGTL